MPLHVHIFLFELLKTTVFAGNNQKSSMNGTPLSQRKPAVNDSISNKRSLYTRKPVPLLLKALLKKHKPKFFIKNVFIHFKGKRLFPPK